MKEFKLGKETLTVSDGLEEYNELHHQYVEAAKDARDTFERLYTEQNHSIESVQLRGEQQIEGSLEQTYFVSLRHFLDHDIYDIDRDLFAEFCKEQELLPVYDVHKTNLKKLAMVDRYVESEAQRREIRKANRSHPAWFATGLGGMISATVMDGITYSVSGALHSGVNAIGNWRTQKEAQEMRDSIYEDDNTLKEYLDAIYQSAFQTHYGYIDLLEQRNNIHVEKYEPANRRSALAMHNNIAMLLPQKEKAEKIATQMLSLDPYQSEFYRNLIENYGDQDGEIQKIGEFFYVDMDDVKKDLQTNYAKSFPFEEVREIQSVIDELDTKADYFGLAKEDQEQIDFATRRDYCKWLLQKTYDPQLYCYLLEPEKKKEIIKLIQQHLEKTKEQMIAFYEETITKDSRYIVGPKDLPDSLHLLVTQNTERIATAFFLDDIGLHYGREEKIAYQHIDKLEMKEHMLVINDTIRIPLLADLDWNSLEQFLTKAVAYLKEETFLDLARVLELGEVEDDYSKKIRSVIRKMMVSQSDKLKNIWRNITLFDTASYAQIIEYNNIKVRLNAFCGDKKNYHPLFWLCIKDEFALFTPEGIVLTENGMLLSYDELEDTQGAACEIVDGTIQIQADSKRYVILDEECYEIDEMATFLNCCIAMLQKKEVSFAHKVHFTQEAELFMEPFVIWMEKMLYSRTGKEGVDDFRNFLYVNGNDSHFIAFASQYLQDLNLEEAEHILFFMKSAIHSEYALIVTSKNIYMYRGKNDITTISLKQFGSITIDHASHAKEIRLHYVDNGREESILAGSLFAHETAARRSVWVERLIQNAFAYVIDQDVNALMAFAKEKAPTFLPKEYAEYVMPLQKLSTRLLYCSEDINRDVLAKWEENAREVYLSSKDYEQIILFYNSVKVAGGNAGIVLTDQYLYVRGKEIFKAAIKDIEEVRVSDLDTARLEIATKDMVYSTTLKGYPALLEFGDLLSDIIFYIKENASDVLSYLDEKEMEAERRLARRQVEYVVKEEQKEALQKIAEYCSENEEFGLFGEQQDEILLNDESDTFKDAYREAVEASSMKPDPVEVPLFLIRPRDGKKKFFSVKKTAMIVTNEGWYNVKANDWGMDLSKVAFASFKTIESTEASTIAKPKVVAKCMIKNEEEEAVEKEYALAVAQEGTIDLYQNFFKLVLDLRDSLMAVEDKEAEEKEMLSLEALQLCDNIATASAEEVADILEKLLAYDYDTAAKAECCVEKRQKELILEKMISVSGQENDIDRLQAQREEILNNAYPFRYKRKALQKVEERLVDKKAEQVQEKDAKVKELLAQSSLENPVFGSVKNDRKGFITMAQMSKTDEAFAFGDAVLLSALVEKKPSGVGGYIILADKLLICKDKKFMAYPLSGIEKFLINDMIVKKNIAFVYQGKKVTLTDMHRQNTTKTAALLMQIVTYLASGTVTPIEQIRIETVTLKDTAQKVVQGMENTVKDMKDKLTGFAGFGKNHAKEDETSSEGSTGNDNEKTGTFTEENAAKPEKSEMTSNVSNAAQAAAGKFTSATERFAGKAKLPGGFMKKDDEEAKKTCPSCGAQVKANGKFCGKCGHKF